jgi:hypothetical protein
MKKLLQFMIICLLSVSLIACDQNDDDVKEEHPLEIAIEALAQASNYSMLITFSTADESYVMTVQMTKNAARVEALGETVFYEVTGDLCYIYERVAGIYTKNETNCSEKGTSELLFLSEFSSHNFVKQTLETEEFYLLKFEYYDQLKNFLNSSNAQNFRIYLKDQAIDYITYQMTRNDITFDVLVEIINVNQTTVNLPVLAS